MNGGGAGKKMLSGQGNRAGVPCRFVLLYFGMGSVMTVCGMDGGLTVILIVG